ncbi:hypothetical protein [Pseudothermotoga thermarum]|uniref:Uncharacterized protein n=1 Tax=Pseudothermotoga thermarum DSM 5069 TaxID=688269 RepID=F7YVK0_9THEM|nr:hypothetical protein [Pseudothermotoga thermarum]AEH51655.1 hypothetical protein Theth_1603 [Pseudothermotoga thermarum DSM 5069]
MTTLETLSFVGKLVYLGIFLVERPKDGENKKKEVKEMVHSIVKTYGIKLPVPEPIFEFMLDFAIDRIVDSLNKTIWRKAQ